MAPPSAPLRIRISVDRYVVIGNPIAHSLSPEIHARFAEETGERIAYGKLLAPVGGFDAAAREFFAGGGRGANVTLPFKVEAFRYAGACSERAQRAGAANFLVQSSPGEIHADNTDGCGLVADLTRNLDVPLRGAAILLLGAGGAARGVVAPLLAERPARIVIGNRTLARARELAERFAALGRVEAAALDALPAAAFDIVINATSSSTRAEPLETGGLRWARGMLAYDMAYGPAAKPFLAAASAQGARASDGLGMLVEQAAESFFLWRGKRPTTSTVIAALRERLA
jgi:shikimate dehydrogenase